jgi:hypothetical protein
MDRPLSMNPLQENIESFRRWFRSLFLPSNRLFYLSLFRVLLGIIILCKILFLWPSTNFLFGAGGLLEYPDESMTSLGGIPQWVIWDHLFLFYSAYGCATVCMLFGIGRRWMVAAVWIATEIHQDLCWVLLDGGDNLLKFSLLYLCFADSFSRFSYSISERPKQEYTISNLFTNLAVAAIIAHLCLVYLMSGLSKAHAEVWYNGTAMYYILLAERFRGTGSLNEFLANNSLFNVVVCYTTIIWESTFCFSVFVKRIRIPILLMGVAMHLSIFALMMIQSFQFVYIIHYGFFFTDDEWARFLASVRSRLPLEAVRRSLAAAQRRLRLSPAPTANIDGTTVASTPPAEAN